MSAGPIFRVRKVATFHDRDAEQLKIARRNVVEFGRMAAFLPGDGKKAAVVSVTERRRPGLSHGVHTGKRRESLLELPLEDLDLLIAVTGSGEVEGSHRDVFHFKARIDELRSIKATQQQPGSEQQNHACRDLRCNESAPQQSTAPGTLLGFSASFLHREPKVNARRAKSGHKAESNCGNQTRQKREGQDASGWSDGEQKKPD